MYVYLTDILLALEKSTLTATKCNRSQDNRTHMESATTSRLVSDLSTVCLLDLVLCDHAMVL